jgi:hypothetical protein
MAHVTRQTTHRLYVTSTTPVTGSMTAWALRDLVRALDEQQVPDDATVTAHHNVNTRHLERLSVDIITKLGAGPAAPGSS